MDRIKVSDLAKELGLQNKDMEIRIKDLNIFIDKGTIHLTDAEKIRELIKGTPKQDTSSASKPVVKRKSATSPEVKVLKIKSLIDVQKKDEATNKKEENLQPTQENLIVKDRDRDIDIDRDRDRDKDKDKEKNKDKGKEKLHQELLKEDKIEIPPPKEEKEISKESPKEHLEKTPQLKEQDQSDIKKDIPKVIAVTKEVKVEREAIAIKEEVKQEAKEEETIAEQPKEVTEKKELKVVHFEKRQPTKPKDSDREKSQETHQQKKVTFTAKVVDRKIQLNKPAPPPPKPKKEEISKTEPKTPFDHTNKKTATSENKKTDQRPVNKHQKFPPKNFVEPKETEKRENLLKDTVTVKEVDKKNILTDIFSAKETTFEVSTPISNLKPTKRVDKKKPIEISEEETAKAKTPYLSKKPAKKTIVKFLSEDLDDISEESLLTDENIEEIVTTKPSIPPKKKPQKQTEKPQEQKAQPVTQPPKPTKKKFTIYESIQVGELAKKMSVKASEVIMKLMSLGVMATVNQTIDYDTAALVASEFGYEVEKKSIEEELISFDQQYTGGEEVLRPPVVTVMGHVDHGKTSLLDAIRHADVASKEAGGITQHIGAYHVKLPAGNEVVFLDTPGHEAFTQMRARGAKVTDIVLLVVAADDGVMAQTREAIDHAREAKVPIIVAINKIDKPEANIDRVKKELAEIGLIPEEWGGDTIFVNISAKKRIGIEELIEMLSLQAEVLELKAVPDRPATGHVIEARLDKGRGPVATLLVSNGTLKMGDAIVCGVHYGKIRAMINDKGENVTKAGPSMPVEVLGLSDVPEAGNEFFVVPDEKKAREISENRKRKLRETELARSAKITLENMFEALKEQELKELKIILKADVQGSVEALQEALTKLSTQDIKVNVIRSGTGAIVESDVLLASASKAIIIGFNVKPSPSARQLAETEGVDIKFYDIIYNALDDVKKAMLGLLEPVYEEKPLGRAEVRQVFSVPKVGNVAGCYVVDGSITRNAKIRLLRDNVVVYTGKVSSLRRFKDDVKEVVSGFECGIALDKFNDIKVGDVIEAYKVEEVAPTLDQLETEQS